MNVKEYLSQPYHLMRRLKAKELRLETMKESIPYQGPSTREKTGKTNKGTSFVEERAVRIADLELEVEMDAARLEELEAEVARAIGSLSDPEETVILQMRYLEYQSWEYIIERMGFSDRAVFYKHRRALEKIVV